MPRVLTVRLSDVGEGEFRGQARLVVLFDPEGRDHAVTPDGAFIAGIAHAQFREGEATVRLIPNSQFRLPAYQWANRYQATIYASRRHIVYFQMPDRDFVLRP